MNLEASFNPQMDQSTPWPWELDGQKFRDFVLWPGALFGLVVLFCFKAARDRHRRETAEADKTQSGQNSDN